MNSFILIDGIVLWVLIIVFISLFFGFLYLGSMNSEKNDIIADLEREKLDLEDEVCILKEKLYKRNFKVPNPED